MPGSVTIYIYRVIHLGVSRVALDECVNTAPQLRSSKIPDVFDECVNEIGSGDVLRCAGYRSYM